MVSPEGSAREAKYDVALSFADEDRQYVDQVAAHLRDRKVKLFYDKYEEVQLWGKDLYTHLSEVYSQQAYFTVMFISKHYKEKLWTHHELKSAQERAFRESREYILPVRFDETEIPGMPKTVGYLSLRNRDPEVLAELVRKKLVEHGRIDDGSKPAPEPPRVEAPAMSLLSPLPLDSDPAPSIKRETATPKPASSPPQLPVVIDQPPAHVPNRKPIYLLMALLVLAGAVGLGYMLGEEPRESPASPAATIAAAPTPERPVIAAPAPSPTLAPTPAPELPRPAGFSPYPNTDMIGGDIRDLATDAQGCRSECQRTGNCIGYSFDRNKKHCYLKSSLNPLWVDGWSDTEVRSNQPNPGFKAVEERFCKYNNAFPTGVGDRHEQSQSVESCEQACRLDQTCGGYAFSGICVLYRSITSRGNGNMQLFVRSWDSC